MSLTLRFVGGPTDGQMVTVPYDEIRTLPVHDDGVYVIARISGGRGLALWAGDTADAVHPAQSIAHVTAAEVRPDGLAQATSEAVGTVTRVYGVHPATITAHTVPGPAGGITVYADGWTVAPYTPKETTP